MQNVPGLNATPRPRHPAVPTPPAVPAVPTVSPTTTCPSCAPLRTTLLLALERLRLAKVRVTGAILSGKEATQRSSLRLGAYDALHRVATKHGTPFQNTDRLPVEYKKIYPRHKQSDGIEKALRRKRAQKDDQWREARMAEVEGGSASAQESSSESDESMESIPEGFSPAHSEDCEDGINVYDGDGEVEGNSKWEDSDGETSSNESGDGESENMGSEEEDGEGSDNDSQNRSDVEMDEDISD
jgi:hypothetical protein